MSWHSGLFIFLLSLRCFAQSTTPQSINDLLGAVDDCNQGVKKMTAGCTAATPFRESPRAKKELESKTLGQTTYQTSSGKTLPVSILSPAQALRESNWVKGGPNMYYKYPDRCNEKALLANRLLEQDGIAAGKVYAFPNGVLSGTLQPKLPSGNSANWQYHVAPFVIVQDAAGKKEKWVIDPAFGGPMPVEKWQALLAGGDASKTKLRFATPYAYDDSSIDDDRTGFNPADIQQSNTALLDLPKRAKDMGWR